MMKQFIFYLFFLSTLGFSQDSTSTSHFVPAYLEHSVNPYIGSMNVTVTGAILDGMDLETGDEIDAVDAEIILTDMEAASVVMLGAYRELAVLEDLFNSIPHFTLDEIEHAQPEYWEKRLTRQTNLQIMAGGVGWAQLDAMRQANLLDGAIEERHEYLQSIAEAEAAQELEAGA